MTGPGLALSTAPKVTAASNKEAGQDHCEDRREPGTETCLVEINERKSIVGLIKGNLAVGIGDFGVKGDLCLVLSMDGRGLGTSAEGVTMLSNILFDELLFMDLVDDALSVAEEGRSHVERCSRSFNKSRN